MALQFLVSVLVCMVLVRYLDTVHAVTVKAYCQPSSITGSEFKFAVRVRTDGDTNVTSVTAVDASVNPNVGTPTASTCMTTVEESTEIYALIEDIDVDSLTCGVVSAGGGVYNIQIVAGSLYYYQLSCDINDLLPTTISVNNFQTTGVTSKQDHHENPYGVKFEVFEADGNNSPARIVESGQNIILRMIYNTEDIKSIAASSSDTLGWGFHTVFTTQSAANAKLVLLIITPGLGTKVHITGILAGNTIDYWTSVKHDSAAEITIPVEYQATGATMLSWPVVTTGLNIQASDDVIGVLVRSSVGTTTGSDFVVFPDDILGDSYRPFSSVIDVAIDGDLEVAVVGTEDGTNVRITYNGFPRPAGFQVDSTDAETDISTDVNLDEYEVLHILCDENCHMLQISADKNIAMVTGWENQGHVGNQGATGHSATQVIPTKYYSDKYVFINFNNPTETVFHLQNDDPTDTTVSVTDNNETRSIASPFSTNWTYLATEIKFDKPVSVILHTSLASSAEPGLMQYPSISQWSIYNSFYAEEGVTYTIYIVTTKGYLANITVSTAGRVAIPLSGSTLGEVSGFAVDDVARLFTEVGDPQYEYYENTVTATSTSDKPGAGLVEFSAGVTWKPFMMHVFEEKDDIRRLHSVNGRHLTPTNPCINVTPAKPGDGINNDCDGEVDEEFPNGIDDDGDGLIDEDLALGVGTPIRGIYAKGLLVDDNADFSSPTVIHSAGCNIITEITSTLKDIGEFTHNTGLHSVFDKLWVIETPSFSAFGPASPDSTGTLYYRVTFDFCLADLSLCENSCASSPNRKRSASDDENFVDLMLTVSGNSTDIRVIDSNVRDVIDARNRDMKRAQANINPCINNIVYWLPVTLILTIVSFEAVMTVIFMHTRSRAKNSM